MTSMLNPIVPARNLCKCIFTTIYPSWITHVDHIDLP